MFRGKHSSIRLYIDERSRNETRLGKCSNLLVRSPTIKWIKEALPATHIIQVWVWLNWQCVLGHCYFVGVRDFNWPLTGRVFSYHHIPAAVVKRKGHRSQQDYPGQDQNITPPRTYPKYNTWSFVQTTFFDAFWKKHNHWYFFLGLWR